MTTHPYRRLTIALGTVCLTMLAAASPAQAGRPKAPALVLTGGDHWFVHDSGYPVVQGPAELQLKGKRTLTGVLAANVHPDDHTMPEPGQCETATAFVYVDGKHRGDVVVSSAGEVCGHHVQDPISVVTDTFTGAATIEEADRHRLEGRTGFLEIRLAEDGRAYVFAIAP
jgi:hypothetical protein